jgi:DNA-binding HxlR family transcriptional regulator
VEKRRHGGFPGAVDYRLTAAGGDLLAVTELHAEWLALAPGGGKALGTVAARQATRSLIEGLSSGLVAALADRPRSLTELDGVIAGLTYPALERRLTSMRRAGLVLAVPGPERRTPFGLSDWLRMASIPLGAASRWERSWLSKTERERDPSLSAPAPTS